MDTTAQANGHARPVTLAPLSLPEHGPVSGWPQDDPGQSRTVLDKAGQHVASARHAVTSHRGWLAAVPIVLVNAVAFAGQLAFLRVHLPWRLPGQVLVAVTLESVAVYLAWQAHLALTAGDSALRLRLAAYSFALVIGVMNYSHYMAPHWRPTFAAVTFGLMSVSSPWLWSVHSRRVSRDALMAAGDIDPHAVRLGATRWLWHGYRSARVMRAATWAGEVNPARAIALVYPPEPVTGDDRRGDTPLSPSPPARDKLSVEAEAARDGVSERTVYRRRKRQGKSTT
jgi:hypothetical protein